MKRALAAGRARNRKEQAHGRKPAENRPHRRADDGEPLLRPHARLPQARARSRRHRRARPGDEQHLPRRHLPRPPGPRHDARQSPGSLPFRLVRRCPAGQQQRRLRQQLRHDSARPADRQPWRRHGLSHCRSAAGLRLPSRAVRGLRPLVLLRPGRHHAEPLLRHRRHLERSSRQPQAEPALEPRLVRPPPGQRQP